MTAEEKNLMPQALLENMRLNIQSCNRDHLILKNIKLEHHLIDISLTPDIECSIADLDERLLIEIGVTHFCDAQKKTRLNALGIGVIEIDLSDFYKKTSLNLNELKQVIVYGIHTIEANLKQEWINPPNYVTYYNGLLNEFTETLNEVKNACKRQKRLLWVEQQEKKQLKIKLAEPQKNE